MKNKQSENDQTNEPQHIPDDVILMIIKFCDRTSFKNMMLIDKRWNYWVKLYVNNATKKILTKIKLELEKMQIYDEMKEKITKYLNRNIYMHYLTYAYECELSARYFITEYD
jgi:hypothetical protein